MKKLALLLFLAACGGPEPTRAEACEECIDTLCVEIAQRGGSYEECEARIQATCCSGDQCSEPADDYTCPEEIP